MAINWTKIHQDHKGKWIALKSDERTVVASANTPKKARELAIRKGVRVPILTYIPTRIVPLAGQLHEVQI